MVLSACKAPLRRERYAWAGSLLLPPHPQHCADCGYKCISCRLAYPVPRSLALYPGVNRKGSLRRLRPRRVHTQPRALGEEGALAGFRRRGRRVPWLRREREERERAKHPYARQWRGSPLGAISRYLLQRAPDPGFFLGHSAANRETNIETVPILAP